MSPLVSWFGFRVQTSKKVAVALCGLVLAMREQGFSRPKGSTMSKQVMQREEALPPNPDYAQPDEPHFDEDWTVLSARPVVPASALARCPSHTSPDDPAARWTFRSLDAAGVEPDASNLDASIPG